jgi:hypothetical protein
MDVKQAIVKAKLFLADLMPELQGIRLEEVDNLYDYQFDQQVPHQPFWSITLSGINSPMIELTDFEEEKYKIKRIYKSITLDKEGNVLSMKIRQLSNGD